MIFQEIKMILGDLLDKINECKKCKISKESLALPGPDFVDKFLAPTQ